MTDDDLLTLIEGFLKDHRYAPTVRELADATGKGSTTIHYRLRMLRQRNKVDWNDGEVRTLRVLQEQK